MNEETDSILYWKQRLEDMTRRWDAAVHEVHLLRGGARMLRQETDKLIAEAVIAEREACAKMLEELSAEMKPAAYADPAWYFLAVATAIRARRQA